MKTLSVLLMLICNLTAFGMNKSQPEYRPEVEPSESEGTNVTFEVTVMSSDCPAMQNCTIHVIVYYENGAEIGSADYVYGTNTYNIVVGYVDDTKKVCASLEVNGYCNPSITPTPHCIGGPYNSTKYLTVNYTCD